MNRESCHWEAASRQQLRRVAGEQFGYTELRPGQEEAMAALLEGRDVLAILPTGAGKSAIYQVAGVLLPGATVIVSPLIALQRDQVESLDVQGAAAAAMNSTLGERKREQTLQELEEGALEYLFLAPEQFGNEATLERLRAARPSLLVVDEAHCISEWGHDFRPDYLRLGEISEALGRPVTLALTATAAPPVRREIIERLRLREPCVIVRGFARPNIWLGRLRFEEEGAKHEALLQAVVEAVARGEKPGIVYVATRRAAEEVASRLLECDVEATFYHGGLNASERDAAQAAWMEGAADVIVATEAFGLGVDKPDVRWVFHHDISDSVDAYYQEIGRSGRDGAPARAVLFYCPKDLSRLRFHAAGAKVEREQIEEVARLVEKHEGPVAPEELQEETELPVSKVRTALQRMEEVEAIERLPGGAIVANEDATADLHEVIVQAAAAQERHRRFEQSRLEMIRGYAELETCRRTYLLNYFGEPADEPCGFCDNCERIALLNGQTLNAQIGSTPAENIAKTGDNRPYPVGGRVEHREWGEGQVLRYEEDKIVVLFDSVGYRTLALNIVLENDILKPVEESDA